VIGHFLPPSQYIDNRYIDYRRSFNIFIDHQYSGRTIMAVGPPPEARAGRDYRLFLWCGSHGHGHSAALRGDL
jgi:hypothetical protein